MMRRRGLATVLTMAFLWGAPGRAAAQNEGWAFSVVPMYFWAMSLDGRLSAGPASGPIALDFSDAKDHLSGAFSVHAEATRGPWGLLADVNFMELSSTAPLKQGSVSVESEFELDNVMVEVGGFYLVNEQARTGVIGGLRTYSLSPKVALINSDTGLTPIDTSTTSPNVFLGIVSRPRISERWAFIGRADIGGGDAVLTWSAVAGLEYRVVSWAGLEFGYKALAIELSDDQDFREYDVTHHGPILGLRLHWGQ